MTQILADLTSWERMLLVVGVAVGAHLLVYAVRFAASQAMSSAVTEHISKSRTIISLITSILVFVLYFGAGGFALSELGVSLKTYFASASILGLAVAFGSQGLVQDVVSGLTVVFTDLFDLGDVVEISGQVGVVEKFGMRFTVLRNPMGAEVFVPNRSITNVISYPRGYVRCLVDAVLPGNEEDATRAAELVRKRTQSAIEQFPGIARAAPEIIPQHTTSGGKTFMRIKFRIWPGRGAPLEGFFRQDIIQAMKGVDPRYDDWMVSVNYEVEDYVAPRSGRRRRSTNRTAT